MKLLVAIASTLLVVLVSQQFASALPLNGLSGFTTEEPMAEHDMDRRTTLFPPAERDMSDFFGTTVETPTAEIKRQDEEPLIDEATTVQVGESVEETEKEKRGETEESTDYATTEKSKRAKTVKVIEKEESKETTEETPKKVKVTVTEDKLEKVKEEEESKEIEESAKETPKKVKVTVEEKLEKVKEEEEHKEIEESTKEIPKEVKVAVEEEKPKKIKVSVEEEKLKKLKEEEEHKEIEESTKEIPKKVKVAIEEEKPKKIKVSVEEEKLEKLKEEEEHKEIEESTKEIPKKVKVTVEEEKPKKIDDEKSEKVKEEKVKESDFCPEGYAKFEESCLFVGTKAKVSARSGKLSSSSPMTNLMENIPVGDDNSCPPGTEHTERGVCQKLLTQAELKLKKVDQGCPENSRLVDGRCIFHSFEQMTSTMEMPLETSERMEVQPEMYHEEEYSTAAPEHKVIVESEFETTMQTVLKA